ncbi:serine/threonine protein kinase [Parasulfuritortus cantonensis]|uniref:Serine/threonine protein kinase n=1 Tax=Parasulfuritortus cantonensis TaxID=2528202 RepID=A0A4R1B1C0_9PROT|nr:serine/threonine-protein kinase [Parasulfuritortus cantonensis]TCJ11812.1 serine/threonine protein kinase [Parasulfuritortus cantonensis]
MAAQIPDPLPTGFQLGEYAIDRKIGGGGFSMVYLAFDPAGLPVAIKEYLPDGMVGRDGDGTVRPISEDKEKTFRQGMKYFFDEGRTLANIRHPNVVEVVNFFRANETVYMVMRYERGKTLQRHIHDLHEEPMREGFVRASFVQLLNGLREIHAQRLLHLDIKPSNIYVRQDGSPLLIDFGAARHVLLADQKYVPMYTPGFAAPEQYNQRDRLGPWTDIYGIGASMYTCIAKRPPPPANERLEEDKLGSAAKDFAGTYSPDFLALIDNLLRLPYTERPQSVFSVQKRLIELVPAHARPAKQSLMEVIKQKLTQPL